jgi:hypothetical protein
MYQRSKIAGPSFLSVRQILYGNPSVESGGGGIVGELGWSLVVGMMLMWQGHPFGWQSSSMRVPCCEVTTRSYLRIEPGKHGLNS